jgi:hypothetical protein
MADLYFFTDTDSLLPQTESYGPFTDGTNYPDEDLYRVTSKLTGSSGIKAYAMLKGKVIAQDVTTYLPPATAPGTPTHVNLILQPEDRLNINIGVIKYIIYKCVLKSSVIDMTDDTKVAAEGSNALIDKIYLSQKNLNEVEDIALGLTIGTTDTLPTSESLGYNLNTTNGFLDTDEISKLFLSATKLEPVNPGDFIGSFDPAGFGIEIVLDSLENKPKLALARSNETLIRVPTLTGSEGDFDLFEHWNKKEKIHSFLDPAALIGSHFREGVYYKTTSTDFKIKNKNTLYTNVVSKFSTRNRVYLDIRNEINKSFNYLRNYDDPGPTNDNLRMAEGTHLGFNYYQYYQNLWPIYFVENLPIPNAGEEIDRLRISLPIRDNVTPIAYVQLGEIDDDGDKYPLIKTKDKERWIDLSEDVSTGYSNEYIPISLPRLDSEGLVAAYVKISYFRKPIPAISSNNLALSVQHPFNNVIQPRFHIIPASFVNSLKLELFSQQVYMNRQFDLGLQSVGVAGIGNDSDGNYTFLYTPKIKQDTSGSGIEKLDKLTSVDTTGYSYVIDYLDNELIKVRKRLKELKLTAGNIIMGDWEGVSSLSDLDQVRGLFMLILEEDVYNAMMSQLSTEFPLSNDYPVFLNLANKLTLTDLNGLTYYEYDLVLTGIIDDNGVAKMHTVDVIYPGPATNAKVYTI